MLVCLVPADRADTLLPPLREHFARDPRVAVVVEQRSPAARGLRRPAGVQHDQRARVAERDPERALPRDLRHGAHGVRFVQRLKVLSRAHEDTDMPELVRLSRAGDPAAVSELWWRCAQRVHASLEPRLGELAAATATPEVLGRLLDELDRCDLEQQSLTSWLDAVVDGYAEDRRIGGDVAG